MPENTLDVVNRYLSKEIHDVDGWCNPNLWQVIWPLYQLIGPGHIGEIGVYEGKFFIGLAKTFGSDFQHAAIDVFDMQEFNLDKAGIGKKDILLSNAEKLGVSKVDCYQRDSVTLDQQDVALMHSKYQRFKFFSVDGCHEVLHTTKDIEFAMQVTSNEGLIAIDDYNNQNWPEVQEAVTKMYLHNEYRFIPLVFTTGKLFLCSVSYHEKYLKIVWDFVKEYYPTTRIKMVKRFGFNSITLKPVVREWNDLPDLSDPA